MSESRAPGVYVEETSFRSKSIEGVATSTCGFVGLARYGPIKGLPKLVTSYEDFVRLFGDSDDLLLNGVPTTNHLAYAVRLFFENGGKRMYVNRLYKPPMPGAVGINLDGHAELELIPGTGGPTAADRVTLRARFPGRSGNLQVAVRAIRSGDLLTGPTGSQRLAGVRRGDVVEVIASGGSPKGGVVTARGVDAIDPSALYAVSYSGRRQLVLSGSSGVLDLTALPPPAAVQKITVDLEVRPNPDGSTERHGELFQGLSAHPDSQDFIGQVLRHDDDRGGMEPPVDGRQRLYLARGAGAPRPPVPPFPTGKRASEAVKATFAKDLLEALTVDTAGTEQDTPRPPLNLTGGSDGDQVPGDAYAGSGEGRTASGLKALGEIDDIAIVAAPGSSSLGDTDLRIVINHLISHCESLRYRFAILSGPRDANLTSIRSLRRQFNSSYAALYDPWLILPPAAPNAPPLQLSPEGAVAGIYARSDIERGVHKAPANETVLGVLSFNRDVSKGEHEVLNPEGINSFRFFSGRGYRVWGARTISSDPEWIYVNVRRFCIFLEHSIRRSTQWAVLEPNNEELWQKIRLTIESFLYDLWQTGALGGSKPEDAFFVRCDRSTMSQGDLDSGRLVCLIGVAPTKPAEFVIFRIGQWTADASII